MFIAEDLQSTLGAPLLESMPGLGEELPLEVIQDALKSVKKKTKRWRALPNEAVIWLVIGMALMRDRAIGMVASQLGILYGAVKAVSSAAIVKARDNLGVEPIRRIFEFTAHAWALASLEEHCWRGLKLLGADGTCLRIPDSPENEAAFGRPQGNKARGKSGYPQIRVVALLALRTRLILGVAFDAFSVGEQTLAKRLWEKLPPHSLTILDKGFIDYGLFHDIIQLGEQRHILFRAKKNMKWRKARTLGPGDELIEVEISQARRKKEPHLPAHLTFRATQYQVKGYQPQFLISSLIEDTAFPADELRKMYHERWELEIAYDELKTHTLEREEALRSRIPERLHQEVWGLFVAYNLVRQHIVRFAKEHNLSPLRVSFRNTLHIVREIICTAAVGKGSIRNLIKVLNERIALLILPERRPERKYPRHVKIKMSNYKRNPGRPKSAILSSNP